MGASTSSGPSPPPPCPGGDRTGSARARRAPPRRQRHPAPGVHRDLRPGAARLHDQDRAPDTARGSPRTSLRPAPGATGSSATRRLGSTLTTAHDHFRGPGGGRPAARLGAAPAPRTVWYLVSGGPHPQCSPATARGVRRSRRRTRSCSHGRSDLRCADGRRDVPFERIPRAGARSCSGRARSTHAVVRRSSTACLTTSTCSFPRRATSCWTSPRIGLRKVREAVTALGNPPGPARAAATGATAVPGAPTPLAAQPSLF